MGEIKVFGISDKGQVRSENQDCFMISNIIERESARMNISEDGLFYNNYGLMCAVADGMGGHQGGAYASELALYLIGSRLYEIHEKDDERGQIINNLLLNAHRKIVETSSVNPALDGMGTTIVGVYLNTKTNLCFHAGDSRLYRFREGYSVRLTSDDSEEKLLFQSTGTVSHGPKSGVIFNCLGGYRDCVVDIQSFSFIKNDLLVLCSDGLSDMVSQEQMDEILKSGGEIEDKAKELVRSANEAGGKDNITVLLIHKE